MVFPLPVVFVNQFIPPVTLVCLVHFDDITSLSFRSSSLANSALTFSTGPHWSNFKTSRSVSGVGDNFGITPSLPDRTIRGGELKLAFEGEGANSFRNNFMSGDVLARPLYPSKQSKPRSLFHLFLH